MYDGRDGLNDAGLSLKKQNVKIAFENAVFFNGV
jgi:hypothetical protein